MSNAYLATGEANSNNTKLLGVGEEAAGNDFVVHDGCREEQGYLLDVGGKRKKKGREACRKEDKVDE